MFEANNRGIVVGLGVVVVATGLLLSCSEPQPSMDMYHEAVALRALDRQEQAAAKLRTAVKQDAGFALAYSELAQACLALGEPERAAQALSRAIEIDPWSVRDHLDLARIYEDLGHSSQAARVFARAGQLTPEDMAAQLGAARCYLDAGQTVQAMVHAEAARKIDPQSEETLYLLMRIYEQQEKRGQVAQLYEELVQAAPGQLDLTMALSQAYMKDEQYDRAREVLASVLAVQPDHRQALRDLALCLLNLGAVDRAIALYERAIALDDGDWEAYRGLGVAYMVKAQRTGDESLRSGAVHHWRRSLEIYPDQPKREWLEELIREHSPTMNPLRGSND